MELLIQILTFAGVFLLALSAERYLQSSSVVRRRLGERADQSAGGSASLFRKTSVDNRTLKWVQSAFLPSGSKDATALRRDLTQAGFRQSSAPAWYVICRLSLAIGLPVLVIGIPALLGHPLRGLGAIVFPLALAGLGMVAPNRFVAMRAEARRTQLEQEFPDALDLMVVCVEAGLGLESAFVRVSDEMRESHPRICEEFGYLSAELGAGRGRAEALRAMAERADLDVLSSFVALLIQTDALGVSIAQSLRTYSTEMRQTRFLKAEEKAMRIPVLLTFPLVACLMPVILVALLLPPVIDVVRTIGPALRHVPTSSSSARP